MAANKLDFRVFDKSSENEIFSNSSIQIKDYFLDQIQSLNRTLSAELENFKLKFTSAQKTEWSQIENAKNDLQSHREQLDEVAAFYRQIIQKEKVLKNQVSNLERNANSKIAVAESKIESLSRATQTHGHANMGENIKSNSQRLSDRVTTEKLKNRSKWLKICTEVR